MPNGVALQIVNNSNDNLVDSQILIFQRNVAAGGTDDAVAWQVIGNLLRGGRQPVRYADSLQVNAIEPLGEYTPELAIKPGDTYCMTKTPLGYAFQMCSTGAMRPTHMEVRNELPEGSFSANIYRSGNLLATNAEVVPGQKAIFQLHPLLYVGVVTESPQLSPGDVLSAAIAAEVSTGISLLGLQSADLVMTGGGPGPTSLPYSFALQNIVGG